MPDSARRATLAFIAIISMWGWPARSPQRRMLLPSKTTSTIIIYSTPAPAWPRVAACGIGIGRKDVEAGNPGRHRQPGAFESGPADGRLYAVPPGDHQREPAWNDPAIRSRAVFLPARRAPWPVHGVF